MTLSSKPVHSRLILDAKEAEVDQFSSADSEYGNVSVIPQRPAAPPAGGREAFVGLALVALERVGRAEPLGRQRITCSVMALGVGHHGAEGPPRLAISTRSESSNLTRRPRDRR